MVLFSKGSELPAGLVGPGAGICSSDDPNVPCGSQDGSPRRLPALSPASRVTSQTRSGLLVAQRVKNLPAMRETWVRSLGSRRSPGEGNGYPLQYPCLGNLMDRGAQRATVHGVPRSLTGLSLALSDRNFQGR